MALRHELDRVARAVVSGRRGLGQRTDRLVDYIAQRMWPRLAAAGFDDRIPPAGGSPTKAPCDHATETLLLARAGMHLAAALAARGDGDTRTR